MRVSGFVCLCGLLMISVYRQDCFRNLSLSLSAPDTWLLRLRCSFPDLPQQISHVQLLGDEVISLKQPPSPQQKNNSACFATLSLLSFILLWNVGKRTTVRCRSSRRITTHNFTHIVCVLVSLCSPCASPLWTLRRLWDDVTQLNLLTIWPYFLVPPPGSAHHWSSDKTDYFLTILANTDCNTMHERTFNTDITEELDPNHFYSCSNHL